ncbi:hypothetical protein NHX12_017841 [Muraenolepis orangiensis]|uniref:Uncharacterized protein n=1 Tax=Muraenolepis orangiensis TaxID=630683 RepID=A0A9Q0F082_9TELE|nr:hypothetical protein NHX12_017841 [Muraenolepis orangiensis]
MELTSKTASLMELSEGVRLTDLQEEEKNPAASLPSLSLPSVKGSHGYRAVQQKGYTMVARPRREEKPNRWRPVYCRCCRLQASRFQNFPAVCLCTSGRLAVWWAITAQDQRTGAEQGSKEEREHRGGGQRRLVGQGGRPWEEGEGF